MHTQAVALDTNFVYFVTDDRHLNKQSVLGGPVVTILFLGAPVADLAVDANYIYWSADTSIFRVAK